MALVSTIYGANKYSPKAIKAVKKRAKKARVSKIINVFRKDLIEHATPAEIAFQHILVDLRLQHEFQKVFGKKKSRMMIVDFWLPQLRLVVEIDGGYHTTQIQQWKDAKRTLCLIEQYRSQVRQVLRFTNNEVLNHPDIVKEKLLNNGNAL